MTQGTGNQPKEPIKLLPITEMEKMSHAELYAARSKAKTTEEQKHIAPYEHRAFAREYVEENPVTGAVGLAVAIPAYQAAKATGLTSGRSGVDTKQMVEGFKGVGEGLAVPWKRVWNRIEESIMEKPSEPQIKPWERAYNTPKKPLTASEEALKDKVKLSPAEQRKGDLFDISDSNINELRRELVRTTSPSAKAILQTELDRLLEKRKK